MLKEKEPKLKDTIQKCLNEINQDYVDNTQNPDTLKLISKYRMMLININKVCEDRKRY